MSKSKHWFVLDKYKQVNQSKSRGIKNVCRAVEIHAKQKQASANMGIGLGQTGLKKAEKFTIGSNLHLIHLTSCVEAGVVATVP